jgi:anti-sigma B factor antagonist
MSANPASEPSKNADDRRESQSASRQADGFSIEVEERGDEIVVRCSGALVAENTERVKSTVKPLLDKTKRLLMDLGGVGYVDSAGLGTLVSLYTSARAAQCEFKLANFNTQIRDLLHITNLLWMMT